ncbi:hypothetical protein J4442_01015 [Candidatus Woesearchaeota archaeon]|nr:hypothetical protein [Candidatus Woesearchaeota archaeon]
MEELDTKKKYKLKHFINHLKSIRGRHTELVSVYVPQGTELIKTIQQLEQEQGTASNIKDKKTKTHVIDSLEKLIRHLRLYKQTPENGLAAFAGDTSQTENKSNVEAFSIEPPLPIKTRIYRCDQTFLLDILEEQLEHSDSFGLIAMDKREATVGLLRGSNVKVLSNMTSGVPGKYKTGGQCLSPDTLVEINKSQTKIKNIKKGDLLKSYDSKNRKFIFSECVDVWKVKKSKVYKITTKNGFTNECSKDHIFFITNNKEKPAETLTTDDYLLTYENSEIISSKILKIGITNKPAEMIDISVKNKNFIANGIIVHNSAMRFARLREEAAHDFYKRIAEVANKEFLGKKELKGILVGGPGPTKNEFVDGDWLNNEVKTKVLGIADITYTDEFGLQDLIEKSKEFISEQAITKEREILTKFLETLGKEPGKAVYGEKETVKALDNGVVDVLIISEKIDDKLAEELEEKATKYGARTEIVSIDTPEGQQFKYLSGIGAILRYSIK